MMKNVLVCRKVSAKFMKRIPFCTQTDFVRGKGLLELFNLRNFCIQAKDKIWNEAINRIFLEISGNLIHA